MRKILIPLCVLLLAACAHHHDVRAGADGLNYVTIHTDDDDGARDAIKQANHFCAETHRTPAFIDESQKYTGDLDEQTYRTGKRVSRVAQVVGGPLWVFGDGHISTLGALAGLGGTAADAALGNGFTVNMRFKCQ